MVDPLKLPSEIWRWGSEMDLGFPEDITWWALLNSQIVATVVTASVSIVAALIARQFIKKAQDEADRQKKKAVEEQLSKRHEDLTELTADPEGKSDEPESIPQANRFSEASRSFKTIRESVDKLTSELRDGRRRRKYQNLRKTDLREHVYFLWQDDALPLHVAELVDDAISEFYSFRTKPNEITDDTIELLARAANQMRSIADLH